MRVEDRDPRPVEAVADLLGQAGPAFLLLAHPLEHQHVGVNRHADRQGQPRQARQREGGLHEGHRPDQQDHVDEQRDDRHDAREPVIDQHEDRHDQHRDPDREDALGDGVLAQGRARPSLPGAGSGSRLAGRLPARSTWIRCSTSLGLNPCGPPSMIPESRISELITGADMTRLSRMIANWYLNASPSSGRCVLRELAEPAGAATVELEPDRRLEPLVVVGPHLAEVLAGDLLAGPIEVAEDPGLDPPGGDLLLADDHVVRGRVVRVAGPGCGWGCTRSGRIRPS